jgi:hypothetical protein
MHKLVKGGMAALVLLGTALPVAAEDVNFTLVNESRRALHYFYAAPSIEDYWGPDLLRGGHTLRAGYEGTVTISDGSTECNYDFKFVMDDGSETVVNRINICDLGSYTIYD